jgi:hypothetical protein
MADDDRDAEDDVKKAEFERAIAQEPLIPPTKPVSRIRRLSLGFVTLLLVLVGLINLAMIVWFLAH